MSEEYKIGLMQTVNEWFIDTSNYERLLHYLTNKFGFGDEAEDIVHDTYLLAYRRIMNDTPFQCQYLGTWIYTIAINLAKSKMRMRGRWKTIGINQTGYHQEDSETNSRHDPISTHSPEDDLNRKTSSDRIEEAIESLTPKYRDLMELRFVDDLPYKEIALLKGMPIGTVKSGLNRGKLQAGGYLRSHYGITSAADVF